MSKKMTAKEYLDLYVNMCIVVKHAKELKQNTVEEIADVEGFRNIMRDVIVQKMEFAGSEGLPEKTNES